MNYFTYQEPYEGESCAGMVTYWQNGQFEYREWIQAPLLEPLVVGQTYWCSFRANAAFGGNETYPQFWLANDKVGMRFTTTAMAQWNVDDPYPVPPDHAHILYPQVLSDTVGWTLVSGSFVADSAYRYVMLGQFFSNAQTDTLHFVDPASVYPWYPRAYTLVDAVCVSPDPDGCERSQGIAELGEATPFVYPNPASDVLWIGNADGREALVLDMLGKQVWSGRVSGGRFAVGVDSWARGTYVLQVRSDQGVQAIKFVLAE
ncbi:MAG: T9SS type A sorting domain-containing protein [Flavobacteriales bacterium]|nr:T9SS type A sorting domain-containing protein [Flavobacteriales bacterium]